MVVSKEKDAKRKRKESPIIESPEMPKRTKVQAQRKFAQGQHAPSSSSYTSFTPGGGGSSSLLASSSAATTTTPSGTTTLRENREPPPELISKRPKPEDFLTFLCFRGTPVLPTQLDFLNQNKNPSAKAKAGSTAAAASTSESGSTSNIKNKKTTDSSPKTRASTSKIQQKQQTIVNNDNVTITAATTTAATTTSKITSPLAKGNNNNNKNTSGNSVNNDEINSERNHHEVKDNNSKVSGGSGKKNEVIGFAVRKRAEHTVEGNKNVKNLKTKSKSTTNSATTAITTATVNSTEKDENSRRSLRVRGKTSLEPDYIDHDDFSEINDQHKKAELVVQHDKEEDEAEEEEKTNLNKSIETSAKLKNKLKFGGKKVTKDIPIINAKNPENNAIKQIEEEKKLDVSIETGNNRKGVGGKRGPKSKADKMDVIIPLPVPETETVGRMTRQRAFFEPVKVPPKPEILIEADDEKIVEKEIIKTDEKIVVVDSKTKEDQIDFSSEDEQPLAKTIKLTNNLKKSPKLVSPPKAPKKKNTNSISKKTKTPASSTIEIDNLPVIEDAVKETTKIDDKKIVKKSVSSKSLNKSDSIIARSSPKITVPLSTTMKCSNTTNEKGTQKTGLTGKPTKELETTDSLSHKSDVNLKLPQKNKKKLNKTDKQQKQKLESEDDSFGKITVTPKKIPRKKQGADADILLQQQSQKDVSSESDLRTGRRPTRKTKEAATIYMELIGQKLNLGDFDEDDFSMDSFPELPNVKETQKMETELKKNVGKPKPAAAARTSPTKIEKLQQTSTKEIYPLVTGDMTPEQNVKLSKSRIGKKRGRKKKLIGTIVDAATKKLIHKKIPKKKRNSNKNLDAAGLKEDDCKIHETKIPENEKSFSDSDDEPLATKITKTSEKDFELSKKSEPINLPIQSTSITNTTTVAAAAMAPAIPAPFTTATAANITSVTTASSTIFIPKQQHIIDTKFSPSPQAASTPNQTADHKTKSNSDDRQLKLITPPTFVPTTTITKSQIRTSLNTSSISAGQLSQIHHTPKHHQIQQQSQQSSSGAFTPLETYPSPKINPTFLTPKFDRNLERRLPTSISSTLDSPSIAQKNLSFPSPSVQASIATPLGKLQESAANTPKSTSPSNNSSANAIANILATNLMPSKEESGKIFGIASVSLAQSSGPDNTKCTLGKCGSVHKPVLGPVVPTESYLGEQQLSSKERRKAKVNMTHEQIQKWLIECSSNPDDIQDDLDDDFDDILKPATFAPTPPPPPAPLKDDKESTSTSSKTTTKQDIGKTESAWSGKGPSLKATPVIAKEDVNKFEEPVSSELIIKKDEPLSASTPPPQSSAAIPISVGHDKVKKSQQILSKKEKKKLEQKIKLKEKQEIAALKKLQQQQSLTAAITSPKTSSKEILSSIKSPKVAPATLINQTATAKTHKKHQDQLTNKKLESSKVVEISSASPLVQSSKITPKRQPVYSTKAATAAVTSNTSSVNETKKSTTKSKNFGAFSPDNEKSVYSFDKEEDDLPSPLLLAKPFRRHSRRDSHNDDQSLSDSKHLTNKTDKKTDGQNSISLTFNPDDNRKQSKTNYDVGAANDSTQKKSEKLSTSNNADDKSTTNEFVLNDSEGETFYIPLQGAAVGGTSGSKSDLLQAVEVKVKVGREGPDGPNQRVCVQATLVTKSQIGPTKNSTTITSNAGTTSSTVVDSNDNKNKDSSQNNLTTAISSSSAAAAVSSKSVPIGTVTPRFKSSNGGGDQQQTNTSGGSIGLTRVKSSSSLFSGSGKSRTGGGGGTGNSASNSKKQKDDTTIKMCNNTAFPRHDDPSQMVEAPVFRPTDKEFHDPMEFIERITPIAARFGICKIIPPATFKPECRVSDDMRFSAYNQYIHKMLHRWGPSVKEFHAIKKHCGTQRVSLTPFPLIGQMEVDLPRLYHTVQELGGLQEVMEKKKWTRVADEMCIPKLAQDRASRLDDIYCKYLLPYDTLSSVERQKLFDEVEADWAKREARARRNADHCLNSDSDSNDDDDDEIESSEDSEEEDNDNAVSMECIVKGKSMPLKQFFRIARNTMSLWFKNTEPNVADVEAEFWRHVAVRDSHVCVHSGSIDSSGWGYGFPSPGPKGKGSPCAKHPWNLKVLTNNPGSVLRSLGPVMGVTVPTLHVGMLFSACCWYRDPHGLSWIEYLHTGASKIWYGIPDEQSANFRTALTALIPTHCQNKTIWLPCDTAMVPPHMLTDRGVSLCRIEQKPGEFVVIFPRAYTSSLSSGYVVSESVYFATASWLELAKEDFKDIHDSCEPAMFSLEQLLFAVASDQRVTADILAQCLPMIYEVFEKEQAAREQLKATGVKSIEKLTNDKTNKNKKKPVIPQFTEEDNECDLCRANLYISMVKTNDGNNIYCLQHALKNLNKGNILADQCKLIFTYSIDDIEDLIKKLKERLAHKNKSTFAFSSSSGGGGGGGTGKKK